jgi:hypothetical protein
MYDSDDRRQERSDAQPPNQLTCDECGQPITAITRPGPTTAIAQPCGHRHHGITTQDLQPAQTDGGYRNPDRLAARVRTILADPVVNGEYSVAVEPTAQDTRVRVTPPARHGLPHHLLRQLTTRLNLQVRSVHPTNPHQLTTILTTQ